MATVIIVLAIVLILGSMLWILPSPKERRQMRLRKAAMAKGISVQLTKIKDIANPGKTLNCIAYRLIEDGNKKDKYGWKLYKTDETWRMDLKGWTFDKSIPKERIQHVDKIEACVHRLPEDCFAVESNKHGTSVYWNERGDEQSIDDIMDVLETLRAL